MFGLVSPTDRRWFEHLSSLARASDGRLDEVNFWRPKSQNAVRKVGPGAPFFLRLKSPINSIAGYGYFAHWQLVPFLEAWSLFGQKNGAPHLGAFREQIQRLRGSDPSAPGSRPLGCIILRDVVFLEREHWLPWRESDDWEPNNVSYVSYELSKPPGDRLLTLIQSRYATPADLAPSFQLIDCDTRRWRENLAPVREGQSTFKLRLLDAYASRCAVTGERVEPVLDAAHIQPYFGPASNHVQNGLLLRTDLHRLYDEGLVTVTPDLRFRVSERIKEVWKNGHEYYALSGTELRPTRHASQMPSQDALAWHSDVLFQRGA